MPDTDFKLPSEGIIETRYLVMPHHTNHLGTLFGGQLLSWIDMAAAMSAQKYSGYEVVTIGMDSITFKTPINIGDHVIIKATVNFVGNTSMEVGVIVYKENPLKKTSELATTAFMTFVALDSTKKPVKLPKLLVKTDDEIKKLNNAKIRVENRKELIQKLHVINQT